MFKVKVLVLLVLVAAIVSPHFSPEHTDAQEGDELSVLAIDYMGEALESVNIYERGFDVNLTVVDQRELGVIVTEGRLEEFDVVLVDNQLMDPWVEEGIVTDFIPPCEFFPELCPPEPIELCDLAPWLPICRIPPCPPDWWSCPPIVWDIYLLLDPWPPEPWDRERLLNVIEEETIMIDPRNDVGFFLKPEIFNIARPNLTIELEDAFLTFTPACNYVMHYDEYSEMGFEPIVVEGYEETPFNVGAFLPASGNAELGAEFAAMLINDTELQQGLVEATGMLPGNPEVLREMLPQ